MGAELGPLASLPVNATKGQIIVAALNFRPRLVELFSTLPALHVCYTKATELDEAIGTLTQMVQAQAIPDWTVEPAPHEFAFRTTVVKAGELQIILADELAGLPAYHPSKLGIYDTADLIERAEQVLPESVMRKMNARATSDVRESGRCLGFGLYTACGVHMMRAVEAILHAYYVEACKPEPIRERLESWNEYIKALRDKDSDAKEVAALIQQMKDHRNSIMHPEWTLDRDEAQGLFETGKTAIMAMAKRLPPVPVVVNTTAGPGIFEGSLDANGDTGEAIPAPPKS
jgi:hypothetical protein